jgi:succinylglutamic semialdehyde dehydrogenase
MPLVLVWERKFDMSPFELLSYNPCTQGVVWQGAITTPQEIAAMVVQARQAFHAWAHTPFADRVQIVEGFARACQSRSEAFALLIAQETGKPLWEARTEVASVIGKVALSIQAYQERTPERVQHQQGFEQRLKHRPHGVLAVLGPYNFPAHLPNGHIVPALLAGNTLLFKPSEHTPAVGAFMAALWQEAGLPHGVLNLVVGARAAGEALVRAPDIDGVLFTGSVETGLALHRQFAGQPEKMLALEMGGNNPLLVWDVADVEAAAALVVQSAYLSAGQRCTCARRLIIPAKDAGDALLAALTALIDRLIIDHPEVLPAPFMGPVIANQAADHLLCAAQALEQAGAVPLRALNRLVPERPFLSPALYDVTACSARTDKELFGPLLQVIRVPDFAAAIAEANRTRFGLAAGLISDSQALFTAFEAQARVGILNWNRPLTGASSAAPFGGIGLSGNHRPSAFYAADYVAYPQAGQELPSMGSVVLGQGVRA